MTNGENSSGRRGKGGKLIALGGVLLALSIVSLYVASFIPGFEITFYTISSVLVAIMMIEGRGKGGWLLYVACSLLSLVILPNKVAVIPYIFFFGIYGILKCYIEKIKLPIVQLAVKFVIFTAIALIAYNFFYSLLLGVITLKDFAPWILLFMGEVFFLFYDSILSWVINYYYRRFYGRI